MASFRRVSLRGWVANSPCSFRCCRDATVEVFLIFQNRDNIIIAAGSYPAASRYSTQTVRLQLHIPAKTTQAGLRPDRSHLADLRPGVTTPGGHRGNEAANLSNDVGKPAGLLLNCMSGRDVTISWAITAASWASVLMKVSSPRLT